MTIQARRGHGQPIVKWLFLLYLLFVIYGSLVPLKYVHRPLGEAILAFQLHQTLFDELSAATLKPRPQAAAAVTPAS